MRRTPLLLVTCLFFLTACSDSDDGGTTGPTTPVFDDVVVSLDQIAIGRDCDPNDGAGEFSYQFYVTIHEDSAEVDRILDADWNSFSANDFDAWDPGGTARFRIERREGMRFQIRLRIREFDGAFEQFSQGTFVAHAAARSDERWNPTETSGVTEYTLYDSTQRVGIVDWDWRSGNSCNGSFRYSVTATVSTEE